MTCVILPCRFCKKDNEMNGIHQKAAALLENVVRWTEVTRRAKSRYQAELAPDFSLMDWLKNDELGKVRISGEILLG